MLYNYLCAKTQVKFGNIFFCTEEVTFDVTKVISESHLKIMDPISRVIYRNFFFTMSEKSVKRLLK